MARINAQDITKTGLAEKFNLELHKKDDEIKQLQKEINNKEKKIRELERGISIYSTDENTTKKILELRSKGYAPTKIYDRCLYVGIEIELNDIKNIVNNIDELDSDLRLYYKECLEDYEKEIKINPQILKQTSLDEVKYLMDKTMESIEIAEDNSEKDKYIKTYKDLLATKTNILKDVVLEQDVQGSESDVLDTTMKEYTENSNKIVKLAINPIDIKTIKNIK